MRSNATFLPLLLEQGSGHIVNTASTAGLFAYAYERLPYSATKAGVIGHLEALALYLRPRASGITCLCPGPVATNIGQRERVRAAGVDARSRAGIWLPLAPRLVGEQVVGAIRAEQFLLLTHPECTTCWWPGPGTPKRFWPARSPGSPRTTDPGWLPGRPVPKSPSENGASLLGLT